MSREKVSAQIESTSDQINSETQGSSENQTLQAAQQQINQEVLNAL